MHQQSLHHPFQPDDERASNRPASAVTGQSAAKALATDSNCASIGAEVLDQLPELPGADGRLVRAVTAHAPHLDREAQVQVFRMLRSDDREESDAAARLVVAAYLPFAAMKVRETMGMTTQSVNLPAQCNRQ